MRFPCIEDQRGTWPVRVLCAGGLAQWLPLNPVATFPGDPQMKGLVGVRGFEPPTPASRRQCSTRLSYTPMGR